MKTVKIEYLDSVHCKAIGKESKNLIYNVLQYEGERNQTTKYGHKKTKIKASFLDKRNGLFLSGFLPKIASRHIVQEIDIDEKKRPYLNYQEPDLKDITFRPYQYQAIKNAQDQQRGIIHAATGAGKTIIGIGLISSMPEYTRALWLVHTVELVRQTEKQLKGFGFDTGIISDGKLETKNQIIIATIQSFHKMVDSFMDAFDLVIVDEAHHVTSCRGTYGKTLQRILTPCKIGLTATINDKPKKRLAAEGLLGPVIFEKGVEELTEKNILAKPIIELIEAPKKSPSRNSYKVMYDELVVNSRSRNRLIVLNAFEKVRADLSVLILVKEIKHGKNLKELFDELLDLDVPFIQGSVKAHDRAVLQTRFAAKKHMITIATTVWSEGIDIPSLGCVINACGGKSEIATLQKIGRGLRKTEGKESVIIVDFLDKRKNLAEHSIERISIYRKKGWL